VLSTDTSKSLDPTISKGKKASEPNTTAQCKERLAPGKGDEHKGGGVSTYNAISNRFRSARLTKEKGKPEIRLQKIELKRRPY